MKLRRLLLTALALVCLAPPAAKSFAQARTDVGSAPFSPAPYRVGERLSYNVSFSNFVTAAHAETIVASRGQLFGHDGFELRGHVETIGLVSAALYAVNNDYVSYVDPATGAPYRLQQSIREGMTSLELPPGPGARPNAGQVSTPVPGTFDFVSALFRLRALPLAQGAVYHLTVQQGDLPFEVELRVTGRETLKTNVGSSTAIATQVRVPGNREANDYRIRIYFTDDELHVPLLITARHAAGEIRAELAGVEMLGEVPQAPSGQPDAQKPAPQPTSPTIPLPRPGGVAAVPAPTPTPKPAATPAPPAAQPAAADLPFKVGEQLNFNFFLGAQPVGTATFQVRARQKYFNREGLLLTVQAQTTGAGQTLFPVADQINSYVDATTLLPFRTELRLLEGGRRSIWVVSSDQDRGASLFDDGARVEIPVGTHDLLSVFYALRSFDLTPGRQSRVSLLVNKRPRLLAVTALRNGIVELANQRIPAVEISLATSDPDGDRFALRLWVSTDRRKLPLRLTAQTPIGPVRADLAIIPVTLQ